MLTNLLDRLNSFEGLLALAIFAVLILAVISIRTGHFKQISRN